MLHTSSLENAVRLGIQGCGKPRKKKKQFKEISIKPFVGTVEQALESRHFESRIVFQTIDILSFVFSCLKNCQNIV